MCFTEYLVDCTESGMCSTPVNSTWTSVNSTWIYFAVWSKTVKYSLDVFQKNTSKQFILQGTL